MDSIKLIFPYSTAFEDRIQHWIQKKSAAEFTAADLLNYDVPDKYCWSLFINWDVI